MILLLSPLFSQNRQDQINFTFSEKIQLPAETNFLLSSKLTGNGTVKRVEADVLVQIHTASFFGKAQCVRCLEEKEIEISFQNSEQIFYSKKQDTLGEEEFYIQHKNLAIDLLPFFRQEVLVHLPERYIHQEEECSKKALSYLHQSAISPADTPLKELRNMFPPKE